MADEKEPKEKKRKADKRDINDPERIKERQEAATKRRPEKAND